MPGNFKMLENISVYLLSYVLHNKTKNYIIAQIIIFKISIGFEVSSNVPQEISMKEKRHPFICDNQHFTLKKGLPYLIVDFV